MNEEEYEKLRKGLYLGEGRREPHIEDALNHPNIVGAHWFQFRDQAVTGRGDGEDYQIGFLDICDTPYWETINACREVGYRMYDKEGFRNS